MTRHLLDEVLDARPPVPPPPPVAVQGWRAIPQGCGECVWTPDYRTLPSTWTLAKADPSCGLHGTAARNKGNGGRA